MKKFFICLFVFAAAVSAQASYLRWQVDSSDYTGGSFMGATITMTGGGGATQSATLNEPFTLNIGDVKDASFYVELMNYQDGSWSTVARSEEMTYAQLSAHMTDSLESVGMVTPWHAGSYRAVPEPTSGVLMLVGLALLGLKRRKA